MNETDKKSGGVKLNISTRSKLYLSAPLPFVGQKRMFAKHFIEVIRQYPSGTVFVDLFGGTGLLSHITKHFHPESRVIYNDFDNYHHRIANIDRTNRLLSLIRPIASQFPRHKPITGEAREHLFSLLEQEERESGYIDFITLSPSLMFSMKYRLMRKGRTEPDRSDYCQTSSNERKNAENIGTER